MRSIKQSLCAQLVELVTEYLEDGLEPDTRATFDEHLRKCEGCVNFLDQMRAAIELTGRLRVDDLSPEMQATLTRAFRGWQANSPG